jgi:hypothetical protein
MAPMSNRKINAPAYKFEQFLRKKIIHQLRKLDISKGHQVIGFPVLYHSFAVIFHFHKKETMFLLKELEREKILVIYPFHGVKILEDRKQ